MRPRAACVTEGHKSPVSLPPSAAPAQCGGREYNPAGAALCLTLQCAAQRETNKSLELPDLTRFHKSTPGPLSLKNSQHLAEIMSSPKNLSVHPKRGPQIHPGAPSSAPAKQSLAAHPLARGLHKSSDGWLLSVASPVAEGSMLLHQRPCCLLSNLLQRWHAISSERAHLKPYPVLLKWYRRLANGRPGPF